MQEAIYPLFFAPRIEAIVKGGLHKHPLEDVEKLEDDLADASIIGTVLIINSNPKRQHYPEYLTLSFNGFKCDRQSIRAIDAVTLDTISQA